MKKILIVGAGAMGAAFSIPLLDNGHSVTLTEPYNFKLLQKLNLKKKIHPSLNINLPQKLKINKFSSDILNQKCLSRELLDIYRNKTKLILS